MSKMNLEERVSRKFINNVESVFEADFDIHRELEDEYYSQVVRPELDREMDREWEKMIANGD